MGRDYARIFTRIWSDRDFLALPAAPQRTYLMLASQASMNYAGVLDLTVGRWSRYAPDTDPAGIRATLQVLERQRFVVMDEETEELLVRSYMVVDEIHRQVRVLRVAVREALAVQSPRLRAALADEFERMPPVPVPSREKSSARADEARAVQSEVLAAVPVLRGPSPVQPTLDATLAVGRFTTFAPTPDGGVALTLGPTPDARVEEHSPATPSATVGPTHTRARASGSGSGSGSGTEAVAEEKLSKTQDQNATEVDARGAVADEPDSSEAERGAASPAPDAPLAAASIAEPGSEGNPWADAADTPRAMPADHCRNHRERKDECGRCTTAAEEQRRWVADRDARVAAARAEARAEIAAQAARPEPPLEPAAPGSGRAEFRAVNEALRARRTERARSQGASGDVPLAASAGQLTAIAAALGRRGIVSRPARLDAIAAIVGHPVGSSKDLSRDEASKVVTRLTGAPPVVDEPPGGGDDGLAPGDDERAVASFPVGETATPPAPGGDPLDDGPGPLPFPDDAAPDPVEYADGSEDDPPGDDAAEAEYRRDQDSWRDAGARFVTTTAGSSDAEPPF